MPAPISDGELGASVRSKINEAFAELAEKAGLAHTHGQSDVEGLAFSLAGKASVVHSHGQGDVEGLADALAGKATVNHGHAQSDVEGLAAALAGKQDALVSGTNIKTVGGQSLLGSGDIPVGGGGGGGGGDVASVNGQTGVVVLDAEDVGALPADAAEDISVTKGTPVSADQLILLDSEDGGAPKLVTVGSLPASGGGGGGGEFILAQVTHNGAPSGAVVGDTLTVTFADGWGGDVQWLRDGSPISGATSDSYVTQAEDEGAVVRPSLSSLAFLGGGFSIESGGPPPSGGLGIAQITSPIEDYLETFQPTFASPTEAGSAVVVVVSSPTSAPTPTVTGSDSVSFGVPVYSYAGEYQTLLFFVRSASASIESVSITYPGAQGASAIAYEVSAPGAVSVDDSGNNEYTVSAAEWEFPVETTDADAVVLSVGALTGNRSRSSGIPAEFTASGYTFFGHDELPSAGVQTPSLTLNASVQGICAWVALKAAA